jgi:DNA repair protein RecO (recombination protein O)
MITESLAGWLIHRRWSGDTSAHISVFTRERGLMRCLYKGCRTPKKQGLLEPFFPLWLTTNQRGEWIYVRSLESRATSLPLADVTLFSALYVNELIYYVCQANDSHPELYDAYEATITALSQANNRLDIELTLRQFEWVLLKLSGFHMSLTHDVQSKPIESDKMYDYRPGEGFQVVKNGFSGGSILAFAEQQFDDKETLRAMKTVMRRAIHHLIDGRPIKSRTLFVGQ